ncbi:hypothetical protein DL764_007960 [Monosporascus ibericus]|uniref:Uncharacterized protein n=1 Tax=Monosporascus ibericus TaxID=155417 RepID=A0A4Q4T1S9_9PEZI|nr:hypothetical protein DL764_007960 [Monosporascus ibericus]
MPVCNGRHEGTAGPPGRISAGAQELADTTAPATHPSPRRWRWTAEPGREARAAPVPRRRQRGRGKWRGSRGGNPDKYVPLESELREDRGIELLRAWILWAKGGPEGRAETRRLKRRAGRRWRRARTGHARSLTVSRGRGTQKRSQTVDYHPTSVTPTDSQCLSHIQEAKITTLNVTLADELESGDFITGLRTSVSRARAAGKEIAEFFYLLRTSSEPEFSPPDKAVLKRDLMSIDPAYGALQGYQPDPAHLVGYKY